MLPNLLIFKENTIRPIYFVKLMLPKRYYSAYLLINLGSTHGRDVQH